MRGIDKVGSYNLVPCMEVFKTRGHSSTMREAKFKKMNRGISFYKDLCGGYLQRTANGGDGGREDSGI